MGTLVACLECKLQILTSLNMLTGSLLVLQMKKFSSGFGFGQDVIWSYYAEKWSLTFHAERTSTRLLLFLQGKREVCSDICWWTRQQCTKDQAPNVFCKERRWFTVLSVGRGTQRCRGMLVNNATRNKMTDKRIAAQQAYEHFVNSRLKLSLWKWL